ncbi:hypothetical protein PQO03_13305 [Lentisphaera profundi]|uniref:CBM-cenC domain-containing protein n=1 Tax=Lentisphaera profundi TaxID=1658616 RepID=A0ABY7VX29_9BACT|nr:hypothetical protein [Lentisphaera profundi]WDE98811.1 hypothetical protein PQO03_13305 [Lentisphaera profundi]
MIVRSLLLLFFITASAFAQREILEDPSFKKDDKYWYLRKGNEYNKLKAEFKKEVFSLDISHTSEVYYLSLLTPASLKAGKTYKLTMEFKGEGEGTIKVNYRNHNNVFKKKKNSKNNKYSNLGLAQILKPSSDWQKATLYFESIKNPVSDFEEYIIIMMGEFQGKINLRKLSLKEATDAPKPLGKVGKTTSVENVD